MNKDFQLRSEHRRETRPLLRAVAAAACVVAVACSLPVHAQHATPANAQAAAGDTVFARVGEVAITFAQFEAAFAQAARGKFYHGKAPDGEVALLQREVGQKLVDEVLLAAEAKRRGIRPDAAAVQKTIAGYDERYKDSAQWKANRGKVLPDLKAKLERDNVSEQLVAQVKNVAAPTEDELRKYYDEHKDKFTSPEVLRLGIILLGVDPSSPKAQWDGAREEGAAIVRRLRAGADFAELAQLHSTHDSGRKGGDLGEVHGGILPEAAQKALESVKPGEITEALVLLEGVAVFRLAERKPPVLNPLEKVRQRATDLYLRDRAEQAWAEFLAALRRGTAVQLDDSRYMPLAVKSADEPRAR